jgi:hypothetical protein
MKLERRLESARANESDLQKQLVQNAQLSEQLVNLRDQLEMAERALKIKEDDLVALRCHLTHK